MGAAGRAVRRAFRYRPVRAACLTAALVACIRWDVAIDDDGEPFAPDGLHAGARPATIDPEQCFAALGRSDMRWEPLRDRPDEDGCGYTDAVRVAGSGVAFSRPFVATCGLALALHRLETTVVQPLARRHLGASVRRIEHSATYHCRNQYFRKGGRRSAHASAEAIDVHAFRLADGRRVSVAAGWTGDGSEAAFLRGIRDAACDIFNVTLGPDYNAAHRDHFHFDVGPQRECR